MVWYNSGKVIILDPSFAGVPPVGEPPLELLLDVIRVALMDTTYAINIDTHVDFDDISASEIVATGYTPRGNAIALASKTIVVDNTNDRAEFDAADLTYTAIGNGANDTFDQIVVMRAQSAGETDILTLLIAHTTVSTTATNGGNITLVWNAEGILHITA